MNRYIPDEIKLKIRASHYDFVNKNSWLYTSNGVESGAKSWIEPFNKPQLVNHNLHSDPIGRVIGYKLAEATDPNEPKKYIELEVRVTDKSAIEKFLDGRYSTFSISGRAKKVLCSVCGQNLMRDGLCEHKRGSYTDEGELVYWLIDSLDYKECSVANDPADAYTRIDYIDVGGGYLPYNDFLDKRKTILSELSLSDSYGEFIDMNTRDKKLLNAARSKLADSTFCYVINKDNENVRRFPTSDETTVKHLLQKIPDSNLIDSAKKKIVSCLKRRAKRLGIDITQDYVGSEDAYSFIDSVPLTFGLHSEWTDEEITSVDEVFEEDPDFDIPEDVKPEDRTEDNSDSEPRDPTKMKKDELLDAYNSLKAELDQVNDSTSKTIQKQKDKIKNLESILKEREDEVNNYVDLNAELQANYIDSVIENIIDLKSPDNNEEREALTKKLESRKIESLKDTLKDLREINTEPEDKSQDSRVDDPSKTNGSTKDDKNDKGNDDPWSVFKKDNRTIVED